MTNLKNRVIDNPITTVGGVLLILIGVAALVFDKIDGIEFAEIAGLGLILAGLKDPSWIK